MILHIEIMGIHGWEGCPGSFCIHGFLLKTFFMAWQNFFLMRLSFPKEKWKNELEFPWFHQKTSFREAASDLAFSMELRICSIAQTWLSAYLSSQEFEEMYCHLNDKIWRNKGLRLRNGHQWIYPLWKMNIQTSP